MLFLLCSYSSCRSCSCSKSNCDQLLKAQPLYPSHVHKYQSNACVIAILLSLNCNASQYFYLTFELLSNNSLYIQWQVMQYNIMTVVAPKNN